jgi:hypothetical protein
MARYRTYGARKAISRVAMAESMVKSYWVMSKTTQDQLGSSKLAGWVSSEVFEPLIHVFELKNGWKCFVKAC